MEFRDLFELEGLLPLVAYQDSNSNVENVYKITWKRTFCFGIKAIKIYTLMERMKNVELKN